MDDDDDDDDHSSNNHQKEEKKLNTEVDAREVKRNEVEKEGDSKVEEGDRQESTKTKMYGPMRPPENYVIPEDYYDQTSDRDLPEIMEKET